MKDIIDQNNSSNCWADFWYYEIGVNIIPANTKMKETFENWSQWQNNPIPVELHERRKEHGEYNKGVAIITGKIWRAKNEGKYFVAIDCDNKKAIEEICKSDGKTITLSELAKWSIVEQHKDNTDKAHVYIVSTKPFKNKSSSVTNSELAQKIAIDEIPAIEVKCGKHIIFCTPSKHKDGHNYEILGTKVPVLCDEFELHLDNVLQKYGIPYLVTENNDNRYSTDVPIEELFNPETKIYKGNRHNQLLRVMESLLQRNKKILSLDKIKKIAYDWNQEICNPPLDEKEFEKQWKCSLKFINRKDNRDKIEKAEDTNEEANLSDTRYLIRFVSNNINLLFKDQFGKLFAYVKIGRVDENDVYEIMLISSKKFESYILKLCYESEDKFIPSKESRNNVIDYLRAEAEFSGNVKRLELRVAKTDDYTFYYDLTNCNGSAVKITPVGWSIVKNPPILFRRYSHQLPQTTPPFLSIDDKEDKIFDKFIALLNVKDDDNKLILKCYIISLFIPDIAKPILMLPGEQGSGKSTLQELTSMLVDPSSVLTLTFPRDINELIQKLSHHYISYFDNVSSIKEWISDQLCRGVTGSGFSKRQLYTDDEDVIYNFKRCIGFNGINLAATKADLLDRGIIIELERIQKKNNIKIEDIWHEFEILRPQLLTYIFDILVKVLQIKQKGGIKIPGGLNRMADFEEYAEIISRCLGYPEGEFLRVYQQNINIHIDEAIEASSLSMAVLQLVGQLGEKNIDELKDWLGTATELSLVLNEIAESNLKINIQQVKSWPKSPNSLSRRLNEIKTNLREKGIEIVKIKDSKGNRLIKICNISSIPSNRQEAENQAQNGNDILDDILYNEKISSKISSNENNENQAQNIRFGRYGDIDDELHIKVREYLLKGKNLKCYHESCDDKDFKSLEEYNNHCFSRHQKQPMYPDLSLIKILKLQERGNPWE